MVMAIILMIIALVTIIRYDDSEFCALVEALVLLGAIVLLVLKIFLLMEWFNPEAISALLYVVKVIWSVLAIIALIANGVKVVCEGANMPSTSEAIAAFKNAGIIFGPAKAANAGGVATSGLEMTQNSERIYWSAEEVDAKLHDIMVNIYKACEAAAEKIGKPGDLQAGANVAGFLKVADAMLWQGIAY